MKIDYNTLSPRARAEQAARMARTSAEVQAARARQVEQDRQDRELWQALSPEEQRKMYDRIAVERGVGAAVKFADQIGYVLPVWGSLFAKPATDAAG